jgi:hypothetical protein
MPRYISFILNMHSCSSSIASSKHCQSYCAIVAGLLLPGLCHQLSQWDGTGNMIRAGIPCFQQMIEVLLVLFWCWSLQFSSFWRRQLENLVQASKLCSRIGCWVFAHSTIFPFPPALPVISHLQYTQFKWILLSNLQTMYTRHQGSQQAPFCFAFVMMTGVLCLPADTTACSGWRSE